MHTNSKSELLNKNIATSRSELNFRNLLDQTPDPILILKGPEMRLEVANQPLFELWQIDESDLGKAFLEILPEMKGQGFFELLQDVYYNGKMHHGYEVPAVFERKEGTKETVYFNFIYKPYRESDNSISGVVVMAINVTSHVLSKKQLEENKEDLRLAVEIAQLGTFRVEVGSLTATYSERILEWFGLERQRMSLNEIFNKIHPHDKEKVKKIINDTLKSPANSYHDIIYTALSPKTGKQTILRSIGNTTFDNEGNPQIITGIIQDITEQTNTQKRIEETERNLRSIISQAPVAMALLKGEDFIVDIANERMFEIWGRGAETMLNKPIFESLPVARNQGFEEQMRRVLNGETIVAHALAINLPRENETKTVYLNFVYEPYKELNDTISGVM